MHPPLPHMFLAEIFANIEQLLIFNRHVVEEFSEIHRTTKVGTRGAVIEERVLCCMLYGVVTQQVTEHHPIGKKKGCCND